MMEKKTTHIDCHRCIHYYVTWNPRFPHGCRGLGFKSKILPSLEVLKTSGQPCLRFTLKSKKPKKPKPR